MIDYGKICSTKVTPQSDPILGSDQVENSAGGYCWEVDDWVRLDRFLIIGSEGGSYYASQRSLTRDNASAVVRCIKEDGIRVVNRVVDISVSGRAPKNDPAIFVMALASTIASVEVKRIARDKMPLVCRTGSHLFRFISFAQEFGGWGRGMRRAISGWYNDMDSGRLAYQLAKYQRRHGWSHRDVLRMAHVRPKNKEVERLLGWAAGADVGVIYSRFIAAVDEAKTITDEIRMIDLIVRERLPREVVPNHFLSSPRVWDAMLGHMPMTAMIRNLRNMSRCGLLKPGSDACKTVCSRLVDGEYIRKSRIHPMQILIAMRAYRMSDAVSSVLDALDRAFYLAFANVEPTGKRILSALDVSGSMDVCVGGMTGVTARMASAALSMITASIERDHYLCAFSGEIVPVTISPRQRLDDVLRTIDDLPYGPTDCAQPMLWAIKNDMCIDTFVIYTDSETWTETWIGNIHPSQALARYRDKTGIDAKLVVVAMASNDVSIADPNDRGMLDVVGFDAATPRIISEFISH